MTTISGMVYDANGDPASRIVRSYRRDTGAMLGQASSEYVAAVAGDVYYSSVALLLPMDGENNSTTIVDYGPAQKTITAYGNAKISTSQSKHGGASLYLDSANSFVGTPYHSSLQLNSSNFTMEAQVRPASLSGTKPIASMWNPAGSADTASNQFIWYLSGDATVRFDFRTSGLGYEVVSFSVPQIPLNQWTYLAIVRDGVSWRLYVNGTQQGETQTNSNAINSAGSSAPFFVGSYWSEGYTVFSGYIDDFRLTNGIARYTGNFSTPDAAFAIGLPTPEKALGQYEINAGTYAGEVQVVCLDDAGGTLENDLIHRTYPV